MREGYARSLFGRLLPIILGREFSGTVAAVGPGVLGLQAGSRVFGAVSPLRPDGCHADYVSVPASDLAPVPADWTHARAAALPFAALSAWASLFPPGEAQPLHPGRRLLVLGAGGAVGGAATQLGVWATGGAEGGGVSCVAGARSAARLLAWGAKEVGDSAAPLAEQAGKFGWEGAFDYIVDAAPVPGGGGGDAHWQRARLECCLRLLKPTGGRYATLNGGTVRCMDELGLVAGGVAAMAELAKLNAHARLHASFGGGAAQVAWPTMRCDWEAWEVCATLAAEGKLEPGRLADALPWELAATAHEMVQAGAAEGKVVLTWEE